MSNHRSATPSRRRSGRARALLSLGAVAVLCTGLSVKGTFALWTDSATATTGSFSSGTLDLSVNGELKGLANNAGTTVVATLTGANLVPGESIAVSFPVKNEGNVPMTYTLTGTGAGALAVTNGLQYSLAFNVAAANAPLANGLRAGTCGGVAATDGNTDVLNGTARTYATNRPFAAGATDNICIVVRLNSQAPNNLQNLAGTASFFFDAKQVGG